MEALTRVSVVGGGLAGALAVIRVIKSTSTPLEIVLIGDDPELGRGIAYRTENLNHLVNGQAKGFGIVPEQPDHLTQWLREHGRTLGWEPPEGVIHDDSFPPRWIYGTYVQQTVAAALEQEADRVTFTHRQDRVVAVRQAEAPGSEIRSFHVETAGGSTLVADYVILATGLFKRDGRRYSEREPNLARWIDDPWTPGAFDAVKEDKNLFIVGTGLSALDAVIAAEDAGFRGTYHAVSRRGLLVQERFDVTPWPNLLNPDAPPRNLRELVGAARAARRAIARDGGHRQQISGAIRPQLPQLWARASLRDKLQFIRHLRSFWENILHRAAPVSAARFSRVLEQGRFKQLTGRVTHFSEGADGKVRVHWMPRTSADGDGASLSIDVDRIVGADGYQFDWKQVSDPLVKGLIATGLVQSDATGFGIAAEPTSGNVIDRTGQVVPGLYAVGHPLRGVNWESNSIGEQVAGAVRTGEALGIDLERRLADEISRTSVRTSAALTTEAAR